MRALLLIAAALTLTGCTRTVYKDRIIEVKVPVTVPCMGAAPDIVEPLRESIGRDEWDVLTTDQRAALLAAQSLAWKVLGWQALDASSGCR